MQEQNTTITTDERMNREATERRFGAPFGAYSVVSFKNGARTVSLEGLSIDAARHVARTHASLGEAARIHLESPTEGERWIGIGQPDYCESYCAHGTIRKGRFAEVLLTAKVGETYHAICCEKAIS